MSCMGYCTYVLFDSFGLILVNLQFYLFPVLSNVPTSCIAVVCNSCFQICIYFLFELMYVIPMYVNPMCLLFKKC